MNAARLLLASALLLAPFGRGVSQISPGPLAAAHHGLDGPTDCAKCHGLHKEPMSSLCLDCHRDIAWGIQQRRGLHSRESATPCARCHPDHAGAAFALVAWPDGSPARFEHSRAGWALEGKHATARCESCHAVKYRVSPAAALSKRRGSAGWLGLQTSCASCHRDDDVHRGALGLSCDGCHDARGWAPAPKFDHASSAYPLTGRHAEVACDKCHLAPRLGIKPGADGKRIPLFKPVAFTECSSCHADPHGGKLSPKCGECHTTRGFRVIDKAGFDHQLTRYALAGRHRAVACEACHGAALLKRDPPFATCGGCHADAHRGEASLAGRAVDCAACHTVGGFAPATYTVAQHRSSGFPLGGRHANVACAKCHTPFAEASSTTSRAAKAVRIRLPFAHCASCHADAHAGQAASPRGDATCEACHSDAAWTPSTYSVAAHAALRLPLEGRHAAIPCAACHAAARRGLPAVPDTAALGTAQVVLRVREVACAACHLDPHAGRYDAAGARPVAGGCGACHDAHAFRPSTVDVALHAKFSFALEGAHRATPCVACHAEMKTAVAAASTLLLPARNVARRQFTSARPATCASCHESPHGAQFDGRKDHGACGSCHDVDRFAPASRFDHDRDASFALAGAHAKVACAKCHTSDPRAGGVSRTVYRPLSAKCENCHAVAPARKPA